MNFKNDFHVVIGRVAIAHEFVISGQNKCDYSQGRRVYGFSYALSGEAEYRFLNGKRYTVRAGDMIYLSADSSYVLTTSGEYRHYTVNFEIAQESKIMLQELGQISVIHNDKIRHLKNTFYELAEIWRDKRFGYEMRATAYVYELFSVFACELCVGSMEKRGYDRILKAKEYIDKNCTKTISVSYLAQMCSMSETNFRRVFLSALGETPLQYRDRLLTSLAKEYLLSGFYTASEVSALCGFDDPSYFGRFFKKHAKMTPGEFKSK